MNLTLGPLGQSGEREGLILTVNPASGHTEVERGTEPSTAKGETTRLPTSSLKAK
jgi:hypothetical protein